MSPSRRFRIIYPLLLLTMMLPVGGPGPGLPAAMEDSTAPAAGSSPGASESKTLGAWRQVKKIAEDALEAPRGPERIAKCEAFLKEHPDYPEPQSILSILALDYLETGDYDPVRVAQLYERMVKRELEESDEVASIAVSVVERSYLKYGLPAESARRLLGWSREALERRRKAIEEASDSATRQRDLQWIDSESRRISLLEGRVLLASGDATGALKVLEGTEEKFKASGAFMVLRDSRGEVKSSLPADVNGIDSLNLSLASAYHRLGNRTAALDRLGRITGAAAIRGDFAPTLRKLRNDMKIPPPKVVEVRADPTPAPVFSLTDLDGKTVSLSDYRGKVVAIMTWATW